MDGRGGSIRRQHRRWLMAATILALALILLIALRWRREEFDWTLFSSTLLKLNWSWLALSAILGILTYYARALRWAVMLRPLKPSPKLFGLFSATAIGFTAIVIFGRPGEIVRPYLISTKEKVPFSSQLAAWLIERIFDMLTALLIFGFAMTQVARSHLAADSLLAWVLKGGGYVAAVVATATLSVFILFRQSSVRLKERLQGGLEFLPERVLAKVSKLLESFILGIECVKDSRNLLSLAFYTVVEWILIVLCFLACLKAFPALSSLGMVAALVLVGFVAFGSLVQIPGIGGGQQIMIVVVLTEVFHQPLEIASGMALVNYFMTFLIIVPFGLILLLHEGLNLKKLKEMEEKEPV